MLSYPERAVCRKQFPRGIGENNKISKTAKRQVQNLSIYGSLMHWKRPPASQYPYNSELRAVPRELNSREYRLGSKISTGNTESAFTLSGVKDSTPIEQSSRLYLKKSNEEREEYKGRREEDRGR